MQVGEQPARWWRWASRSSCGPQVASRCARTGIGPGAPRRARPGAPVPPLVLRLAGPARTGCRAQTDTSTAAGAAQSDARLASELDVGYSSAQGLRDTMASTGLIYWHFKYFFC
jgi:hypothetical protein